MTDFLTPYVLVAAGFVIGVSVCYPKLRRYQQRIAWWQSAYKDELRRKTQVADPREAEIRAQLNALLQNATPIMTPEQAAGLMNTPACMSWDNQPCYFRSLNELVGSQTVEE